MSSCTLSPVWLPFISLFDFKTASRSFAVVMAISFFSILCSVYQFCAGTEYGNRF
jgi:hypothetical protein